MTTKAGKEYKERLLKHFVSEDWKTALAPEFSKAYFNKLCDSLAQEESAGSEVFPPIEHIFEAFNFTSPDQVKAVILGQDPYHDNGQAHGLCFSVQPGVKVPPSLRNMYTEMEEDIEDFKRPTHGYLLSWAKQGILMFNATMTVQAHKANSHKSFGWQTFTDAVIDYLNVKKSNIVFALWGGFAQKKGAKISSTKHAVLKSAHPSPLSVAKWKGSRPFSKINEKLVEFGKDPINWTLPDDPELELPEGMPEASEAAPTAIEDADEADTPSPSPEEEEPLPAAAENTEITEDLSRLKLTELRALCREQGVSPSGKKADVVSRLQNIQAGIPVPALGKRKRGGSTSPKRASPTKQKKPKTAKVKADEEDTEDDSPDTDQPMKEEGEKAASATKGDTDGFAEPQKSDPKELKIVSWNVAGWKAVLKKGFEEYANKEEADIICLQETKIDPVLVPSDILPGYQKFFSIGDKKGYAGTGIFSKVAPISTTLGIQIDEHDNEGRVITAEYETFYLVTSYIPNSGRKLVRLDYRMQWDKDFFAYLKKLDKVKPVIWCGDLNVSHLEIDIANPKGNKRNAGFTDEERESFGGFLADGFTDIYRKLYPDEKDCYTYWTYMSNARARNVGWRLDYFIVSNRFVSNVSAYFRRNSVLGSDHCPIGIIVKP